MNTINPFAKGTSLRVFKINLLLLVLLGFSSLASSQESTPWWKSLFGGKNQSNPTQTSESSRTNETIDAPFLNLQENEDATITPVRSEIEEPQENEDLTSAYELRLPGTFKVQYDPRIATLDSAWKALRHPVEGYRVQLHLGTLQSARLIRSQIRKQTDLPVYLSSLPPSYRVTLGDFHDRWSAEQERKKWMSKLPLTLVIPMEITVTSSLQP